MTQDLHGSATTELQSNFDLNAPEHAEDPAGSALRIADGCPVFHSDNVGWVVAGYPELYDVARDHETYRSDWGPKGATPSNVPRPREVDGEVGFSYTDFPILPIETDPPEHTAYRRLLQASFTGDAIERAYGEEIRGIAEKLVSDFVAARGGEFVAAVSYPMSGLALAAVLGIPPERRQEFQEHALRLDSDPAPTLEFIAGAIESAKSGAFGILRSAMVDGRPLTDKEKLGYGIILIHAGWETTAATISTIALRLAQDSSLRAKLLAESATVPTAVEEFLRIDSAVAGLWRTAAKDVELAGRPIHRGDKLLLMYGVANRDAREFNDPDELDIHRHPNHHLAFGVGVHRCLGAALARAEIKALLEALLRHPALRLDDSEHIERGAGPVPAIHRMVLRPVS